MKVCCCCNCELPLKAFSKNSAAKDGKMSKCSECNRKAVAKAYEKKKGTKKERKENQKLLFNKIKNLRKAGHTLKDISEEVGLTESTISYYLSGKRKVGTLAVKKSKIKDNNIDGNNRF